MPSLAHSPADVIAKLLVDGGLGTDSENGSSWPVYVAGEPNIPDNCITVYDTEGTQDGRTGPDGEACEHSGFQVRVRSSLHTNGWVKANAIRIYLAETVKLQSVTIGGAVYQVWCIANIGSVLVLGKDAPTSKRTLFTLNATAPIRQTA